MTDSNDRDFYIGEHPIYQNEKIEEIGFNENKILRNCALNQTNIKFKLLRILNRLGNPILHFKINRKMYFYGIRGVRADYKIVLQCTRTYKKVLNGQPSRASSEQKLYQNEQSKSTFCGSLSLISPSDSLK